jgi:hypothetical protein
MVVSGRRQSGAGESTLGSCLFKYPPSAHAGVESPQAKKRNCVEGWNVVGCRLGPWQGKEG